MGRGVSWRRPGQPDGDGGHQSRQLPDSVSGKPAREILLRFSYLSSPQERPGCNYFAWVNSQHEVASYRNTCWLKATSGTAQPCATCVSGPRQCEGGGAAGCCPVVTVQSSGDTGQWSALEETSDV